MEEFRVQLPVFTGEGDELEPYCYLDELQEFCNERQIREADMLNYVLLRSLRKSAKSWFNQGKPFLDCTSFKGAFLAEFFSFNYTL